MTEQSIRRESVVDALSLLVRTPSVNPVLAPEEGCNELAVANAAVGWLQERGVRAWVEEVQPGRANAVAEVGSGERALVFCGHIDTVQTAGMTISPFDPRIEDGRLYGRGAYDMKGGVAAIMCALEVLATRPFDGRVMAALVADEEVASLGAAAFVQRYQADACVVTEPSAQGPREVVLAHKGFVWAEITTAGFATHGSRWDLGVSAIAKMGPILAALDEYDRNELRRRMAPLVGPASMHCATISGGAGWSTYAEQCVLRVERRTIPGETTEQVMEELAEVVARTGVEASIRLVLARSPMVCPPQAAIAQCARRALEEVTGHRPTDAGVGYWMDAALFHEAGVPTVNFGSTGAGAHEAEEWVDLETVHQTAEALVRTALHFFTFDAR